MNQRAMQTLIDFVDQFLSPSSPDGQPLIIEVYGDMPEVRLCEELADDQDGVDKIREHYASQDLLFDCRYVEYYTSVIFGWTDSLRYRIQISRS